MPLLYEDLKFNGKTTGDYADSTTITVKPQTVTPPGTVTVTVTDFITKAPIANAKLTSGINVATTDATGSATIALDTTMIIHISASWHLAKTIVPTTSPASVSLIPIWLIAAGAGGAALIVIGVVLSTGTKTPTFIIQMPGEKK